MKDDLKDSLSAIRDKKLKTINPATEEVLNEYELISKGQLNDTINKSKYTRADFLYAFAKEPYWIIQFVQQKNPGDILSSIQNIEDRQYQNVSDVASCWSSLLTKRDLELNSVVEECHHHYYITKR